MARFRNRRSFRDRISAAGSCRRHEGGRLEAVLQSSLWQWGGGPGLDGKGGWAGGDISLLLLVRFLLKRTHQALSANDELDTI